MPRRAEDEQILHILDLYTEGLSPEQIAKTLEMSARAVKRRLKNVVHEDCLHDPEADTYWKGTR